LKNIWPGGKNGGKRLQKGKPGQTRLLARLLGLSSISRKRGERGRRKIDAGSDYKSLLTVSARLNIWSYKKGGGDNATGWSKKIPAGRNRKLN